jgi:hypothetical protein
MSTHVKQFIIKHITTFLLTRLVKNEKLQTSVCLLIKHLVTYKHIARKRLDKHSAICAGNNRRNVCSSLLDNSQRTNELARYLSRDFFSVRSALRNKRTVFCALSVLQLYNASPGEFRRVKSPWGFSRREYKDGRRCNRRVNKSCHPN